MRRPSQRRETFSDDIETVKRARVRVRERRGWERQWDQEKGEFESNSESTRTNEGRRRNGERCRVRECDWECERGSGRALQSEKRAFRILKMSHFPRWHKIFIFFPTSAVSTGGMPRSSVNLTLLNLKIILEKYLPRYTSWKFVIRGIRWRFTLRMLVGIH